MSQATRTGSAFERALADYFTERGTFGHPVFQAPKWGAVDKGDLVATDPFTFQAKATKVIDLAKAVSDARVQADNAGTQFSAAIFKRRNHTIDKAYVVMTLAEFSELLLVGCG